jgi:hypothetical protein
MKPFEVWSVSGGRVKSFVSEHPDWHEAHDEIMNLARTARRSFTVIDNRDGHMKRPPPAEWRKYRVASTDEFVSYVRERMRHI